MLKPTLTELNVSDKKRPFMTCERQPQFESYIMPSYEFLGFVKRVLGNPTGRQ